MIAEKSKPIPINDPLSSPEKRGIIDRIILDNKDRSGSTMLVLNELQNEIGFITEHMQVYVAQKLRIPVGAVHGVVTFYSFFSTKPRGVHTIKFCLGTACYVGGVSQLIDKAKQVLEADLGDTTSDGQITLETCRCVGACSQAPVIVADEDLYGRVTPNKLPQILRKYQKQAEE